MSKYIIVGAGASGLVCAINLKRKNNDVIVLEKNDKSGKKILATGNGHCNYYNEDQNLKHYHSSDNSLIEKLINPHTNKKVLEFFSSIGIVPRIKNGYYYPYSNAAVSIQNTLVEECTRLGVTIYNNVFVEDIIKDKDKFIVITNEKKYEAEKVVISTGSNASLKEENNMYGVLEKLGHKIIKPLPALTRLNLKESFLKEWSGIRNDVEIKILVDEIEERKEYGEILYTDNGISGIVTMQLSNIAAYSIDNNKKVEVIINNMISFCKTRNDFIELMNERNNILKNRSISQLLDSYMNYKLVNVLIKRVGINPNISWNKLSDRDKNILASSFVELRLNIISTDSIAKAQTVSGGVVLSEINLNNMESKIVNNLYLTGEVIDLFGDCGGYNLTIAWTTGLQVGDTND